jgi:hypothetical protein
MRRTLFLALLMVHAGLASAQRGIVGLPHTGRPPCCTSRHGFPHGQFVFPFYPFWYEDESTTSGSNISATTPAPAPPSIPTPPLPPPAKAQVIEVPESYESTALRPERATVFVLKDGTRIYTRRYLLTTQALNLSIGQQERQFPFSALDVNATLAANRAQRVALRIPADAGEVTLGF